MMNTYVTAGDMAPVIVFYNGPGASGFGNLLIGYYGTGYTPSFFCDGVWERIGWSQSACQSAINSQLAVPSYVDIDVTIGGDDSSGVVYYNIIAERDLQPGTFVRLLSAFVESGIVANSSWGGYNGQTVNWIPRLAPLGNSGITLDFQGPYPETLSVQGQYTINPAWNFDNIGIVTFVIDYSDKEVYNAFYAEDLGSIMGIESAEPELEMTVGPNPCGGAFSVSCNIPDGVTGRLDVFDLSGRMVLSSESSLAGFVIEQSGLYFVRLTTSEGTVVTRSVAVTR
ncbi:MAG: T9SS type A sorting domain-containing protein [Candidatus Fermentibacteraceae bacterium]|nr:T9SS type A sorting domain-containing protein [Candidatus Fermentibacteraceae bacterium]